MDSTDILLLYQDYPPYMIKTKWSRKNTNEMYCSGWKYCSSCGFMVKTKETNCRYCNRMFRTRTRKKSTPIKHNVFMFIDDRIIVKGVE